MAGRRRLLLRAMLTRLGPVSSPVFVSCDSLAGAGALAATAESFATAFSAATVAPVTSCTSSPSPGSGLLPHTPPPPGLHSHRVGHWLPDWQECGPIATVRRRFLTRPLFSLVRFSLNANKRGRGVGRGRRGSRAPSWDSSVPHPLTPGGWLLGDAVNSRGWSRQYGALWSPVSLLHALLFPWPRCNRAAARWPPPVVYSRGRGQLGEAGRRGWGFWGTTTHPLHFAGPILRRRIRAPDACPGAAQREPTC